METLNDEGQWIVMMGFLVAIGMFVLALIMSQAPLVGQTTAESVMEFPKNEIQDVQGKLLSMGYTLPGISSGDRIVRQNRFREDVALLSMSRNNAIANYSIDGSYWVAGSQNDSYVDIHYNNGVTQYSGHLPLFTGGNT